MAESKKGFKGTKGPGFQPGKSGNAGGLSARQHQVRRELHTWLASEEVTPKFKKAYLKALESGEPAILRDCADRLLGKVKLPVELGEDTERPLLGATAAEIIAALKGSTK